jgi:hypothetical protein
VVDRGWHRRVESPVRAAHTIRVRRASVPKRRNRRAMADYRAVRLKGRANGGYLRPGLLDRAREAWVRSSMAFMARSISALMVSAFHLSSSSDGVAFASQTSSNVITMWSALAVVDSLVGGVQRARPAATLRPKGLGSVSAQLARSGKYFGPERSGGRYPSVVTHDGDCGRVGMS